MRQADNVEMVLLGACLQLDGALADAGSIQRLTPHLQYLGSGTRIPLNDQLGGIEEFVHGLDLDHPVPFAVDAALDSLEATIALVRSLGENAQWIDLTQLALRDELNLAEELMRSLTDSFAGDNEGGFSYDTDIRRLRSLLLQALAAIESRMIQVGLLDDLSIHAERVEEIAASDDTSDSTRRWLADPDNLKGAADLTKAVSALIAAATAAGALVITSL